MALPAKRSEECSRIRRELVDSAADPFAVAAEALEKTERYARYVKQLEGRLNQKDVIY